MSSSIKNLYQFRTTSKITQAQAAASTFTVGNDIFTNTAVSITAGSIQLTNRTGSIVELFTVTVAAGVATIATRGIKPDGTTDAIYQYERPKNTLCTLTVLENQIFDKGGSETITGNLTYSGNVIYTKSAKFPVYADATARDAGIPSPANGMMIYNTALGFNQQYIGGAWVAVDTGTATGNATEGAVGLGELGTTAEVTSGAATGGAGPLILTPEKASAQIQSGTWLYAEDAGANDTYVVTYVPAITALTEGMILSFYANTVNTGACTLNVNGLGAKNIITKDANNPQSGVIRGGGRFQVQYDGTSFVLLQEDFATTTVLGTNKIATDAVVATGTNETDTVNAKQLRTNSKSSSGKTSRNTSASTGTQNIAHGLGVAPRLIEFRYVINASVTGNAIGVGTYNGTTNYSLGIASGSVYADSSTLCINHHSGSNGRTATCTVDDTNIILSWTKVSSGINTEVLRTAHA